MTIRIDGTNTAANPGITGTDTDTGLQFGTDEVNIVTGGTTAVTVDSSQRVGIGTASPGHSLSVDSGATGVIASFKGGTQTGYLYGDNNGIYLSSDTGVATGIGVIESDKSIRAFVNGSERARFLSGGGLTFNGDTAAANALDDYEEGTWTPAIASGGWTLDSTPFAKYVKIGKQVTVQCFIDVSGSGNSNDFTISGLPFTPPTNGYSTGVADFYRPGKAGICVRVNSNSTTVSYLYSNESVSTIRGQLIGTDIGSGYHIFTVTYQV